MIKKNKNMQLSKIKKTKFSSHHLNRKQFNQRLAETERDFFQTIHAKIVFFFFVCLFIHVNKAYSQGKLNHSENILYFTKPGTVCLTEILLGLMV